MIEHFRVSSQWWKCTFFMWLDLRTEIDCSSFMLFLNVCRIYDQFGSYNASLDAARNIFRNHYIISRQCFGHNRKITIRIPWGVHGTLTLQRRKPAPLDWNPCLIYINDIVIGSVWHVASDFIAKDPEGLDSDRWIPLRGGARIPRGL